jgi:hypothetical protein
MFPRDIRSEAFMLRLRRAINLQQSIPGPAPTIDVICGKSNLLAEISIEVAEVKHTDDVRNVSHN